MSIPGPYCLTPDKASIPRTVAKSAPLYQHEAGRFGNFQTWESQGSGPMYPGYYYDHISIGFHHFLE